MNNTLIKVLKNPRIIALHILNFKISSIIPDRIFLKIKYRIVVGKRLNLSEPVLFNEKLQWLKLYDRNQVYTELVDKFKVRNYIANRIGEKYLIPLIGVYDSYDDIDFDTLPNQFVLKPNHTSGNVYICIDKKQINHDQLRREVNSWLKRNYFRFHREWPYKGVKPRIVCEKYMVDESGLELKDYKIFCFNGIPKMTQVDYSRFVEHKRNFYDENWNLIPLNYKYPSNTNNRIDKPENFKTILRLASELSQNFPFARVDFYSIDESIYFGEITFYPEAGFGTFNPSTWDLILGDWIDLNICIKKSGRHYGS